MSSDPNLLDTTEFERRLLEAAGAERPSPELSARMANALGLPPSPGIAALPTAKLASGWLSLGVLAAALGGAYGTWALLRPSTETSPQTRAQQPSPPKVAATESTPASVTEVTPTAAAPAEAALVAAPTVSPAAAAAPPRESKLPSESGASSERGDLREEIRAIDAVRGALAARAPAQALSLLRQYGASYPNGTFGQEAAVLRIEALEQSGQHQKAQALSREFRSKHPNSPLSERLERLSDARN